MIIYLRVFNFLWRAKRMEYILAGIWKGQMSNSRMLKSVPGAWHAQLCTCTAAAIIQCNHRHFAACLMPIVHARFCFVAELSSIFHQCHVIGCEMVHFVQQVQYYINFEVCVIM